MPKRSCRKRNNSCCKRFLKDSKRWECLTIFIHSWPDLSSFVMTIPKIKHLSTEISKGKEKARQQEIKNREMPEIVVKVVCKYRAELFFKIGRKMKLSRLMLAWSERMESVSSSSTGRKANGANGGTATQNGAGKESDAASTKSHGSVQANGVATGAATAPRMGFQYFHQGRALDPTMTIEVAGIEHQDEILAVEFMDLTGPMPDDAVRSCLPYGPCLELNDSFIRTNPLRRVFLS